MYRKRQNYFFVNKQHIKSGTNSCKIIFEASSKEELTKDIESESMKKSKIDLEFMKGYRVDRGEKPNSFFMSDNDKYYSLAEVYAEDIKIAEFLLVDDPADSTGCLSWLYQQSDSKLDEAGSYGYLCQVEIAKDVFEKLPDVFKISICADNGISIFGRKSGGYPVGMIIC